MASAAHLVFATPELLEQILLELPIRGHIMSRRVSRRWADTIKDSPMLHGITTFRKPMPMSRRSSPKENVTMNPKFPRKTNEPVHKALQEIKKENINNPGRAVIDHKALFEMDSLSRLELISQPPIQIVTFGWVFAEPNTTNDSSLWFKGTLKNFGQGATFGMLADKLQYWFDKASEHPLTPPGHQLVDYVWMDLDDAEMDETCQKEGLENELSRL
ncbi:hypothetical protein HII31_09103 [Pseudocercospora fuligena]|uniref:F-box domain-containing protein n=1 Tax=Pseudocercospora fuligena TaxID=685502 RepID=A0A8H6VEJ9_9PEZI|nr:hypothetical protein HII31_09103 [Pseudocercospora fuligena]